MFAQLNWRNILSHFFVAFHRLLEACTMCTNTTELRAAMRYDSEIIIIVHRTLSLALWKRKGDANVWIHRIIIFLRFFFLSRFVAVISLHSKRMLWQYTCVKPERNCTSNQCWASRKSRWDFRLDGHNLFALLIYARLRRRRWRQNGMNRPNHFCESFGNGKALSRIYMNAFKRNFDFSFPPSANVSLFRTLFVALLDPNARRLFNFPSILE